MSPVQTWRSLGTAAIAFLLLTLCLTYPQVRFLSTHVGAHYDALFSIWRLAWIAHQLPRDALHLFDANIFHPERNTLAYSDPMLFEGLLAAPLIWSGVTPVVAYNLLVLMSFVAAGTAMFGWLTYRQLPVFAAALGAAVFAFQQYAFAHFPQLELLWTCWIPLAFWALEKTLDKPRLRHGVALGAAVGMQLWSCLYYGVFLVTGLALVAAIFVAKRGLAEWRRLGLAGVAAIAVTIVLCLPYVVPYAETRHLRAQRTGEAAAWSASPENYISTTENSWLHQRPPRQLTLAEGVLYPGLVAVALAIAGAARARNVRTWAYLVLGLVAFDLTLGVHGVSFGPLQRIVPVYASLRVPARMFVLVAAALALLAATGAAQLMQTTNERRRRVVGIALIAVILLESASVPLRLTRVPEWPAHLYDWLAAQPPAITVEWPLPRAHSLGLTRVPHYMFYSTRHWQPLTVGYSGLYPEPFFAMIEEMASFPSPQSLAYLRRRRVKYLILHSEPNPKGYVEAANALAARLDVRLLRVDHTTDEEIAIYEVLPRD